LQGQFEGQNLKCTKNIKVGFRGDYIMGGARGGIDYRSYRSYRNYRNYRSYRNNRDYRNYRDLEAIEGLEALSRPSARGGIAAPPKKNKEQPRKRAALFLGGALL
jgi:hypothetical protein